MVIYSLDDIKHIKCGVRVNDALNRTSPCGEVKISLTVPVSYAAFGGKLCLICDDDSTELLTPLRYVAHLGGCDKYEASLEPGIGLYYFYFTLDTALGSLTLGNCGDELHSRIFDSYPEKHQLLIYDADYKAPDFSSSAVYQIFVDRFCKKGKVRLNKGALYDPDWDNGIPEYAEYPGQELKNNTFFGGNLDGVIEKLPYLSQLGINTIYLCPIFKSASNHKYDTGDYEKVDISFGTVTALKRLIKAAHERGIKLILDGVFNHTGDDSRYFNKYGNYPEKGAYNGKNSKYYSWYKFTEYPDEYKCWWGVKILPTLDTSNDDVIDYFTSEDGIIRKYLRLGIDGWRLDVADELDERLLVRIKEAAVSERADSIIIGEVWEDASNKISYSKRRHYFSGHELDSVMNYPLRDCIISFIKGGSAYDFEREYTVQLLHYPPSVSVQLLNFLGTHDTERIMTVLGGQPCPDVCGSTLAKMKMSDEERQRGKTLVSLAFAILSACPGMPCIYYGDEVGMEGYRDPFNRKPFPWKNGDFEFSNVFAELLEIRRQNATLRCGSCRVKACSDTLLCIIREYEGKQTYAFFNASAEKEHIYLPTMCASSRGGVECRETELSPFGYEFFNAL